MKRLYLMAQQGQIPPGTGAVLCTLNPVSPEKLVGIPYVHIPFADTVNEVSPDAFTREMAEAIRTFVDGHRSCENFYFCCDSGESRSAALAAATLRYLGGEDTLIWGDTRYHPNGLVFYRQCMAYGQPVTWELTQELCQYNQYLLHRQIEKQRRG